MLQPMRPLRLLCSLALLVGCSKSFAGGTDASLEDASLEDRSVVDSGRVPLSCEDALRSPEGSACAFMGACASVSPCRSLDCVGGMTRDQPILCADAGTGWASCEEFLASEDVPGVACMEGFGACQTPIDACCSTVFSCQEGIVVVDGLICLEPCEMLALCDDYSPPFPPRDTCTDQAQCDAGEACVAPHGVGCGPCVDLVATCASDADCSDSDVCVPTTDPCMCAGPGSECIARCDDASCGDGERCEDGRCLVQACTDGYECPPNLDCGFGGGGDAHGCIRRGCASERDCDCGACIDGVCARGPGICALPAD